ncbi:MAG: NYN domain-containing protein [Chloroflexaceae bacterium]|nr:NYN domain-containing protein [Chloroflexaceae bacterium]
MSAPPSALLLVDGYNIIGTWPQLKVSRDTHGLEVARRELIESLINYSAHKGYKTQVVFDAQYQNTPSNQEDYTETLSAYFTAFGQTADTYIEKLCAALRASTQRTIVATSDQTQRHMIVGYGAFWLSALQLYKEVELTARLRQRQQRGNNKRSSGRYLMHSLDATAKQRLEQWRQGIY